MYRNHSRDNKSSSLYDIVFLMAAGFFILFMVALWYVNPIAKLGKIDSKAEFIITVEWPSDYNVDVDSWLMDPNGILVWFSSKSPTNSPAHLDRDDLGNTNDTIMIDGIAVIIKQNIEIITIRGILPGEYVLNIHFFSNRTYRDYVEVSIKAEKLNPTVTKFFYTTTPVVLKKKGDEITVMRFTVEADGSVSNVSTGPPISLINVRDEARKTARERGGPSDLDYDDDPR